MNKNVKECSYCGALCDIDDTYCKKCSHNFVNTTDTKTINNEPVLDGFDNADVKRFLGKNADYYEKKFAKSKDKNVFLQLNFPAIIFGVRWYIFRKMYHAAIFIILLSFIVTTLSYITVSYAFSGKVEHYYTCKQEYIDYNKLDVDMFITNEQGYTVDNPEYDNSKRDNLKEAQNTIRWLDFFVTLPGILINVVFGFLGNYYYKKHTTKNLKLSNFANGGTNIVPALIFTFAITFINILYTLLLTQIPAVSRFYNAVNGLYVWM